MNPLRWWEIESWTDREQRLIEFEDSLFLAFPISPPNKDMPLIDDKHWTGYEWEIYPYKIDNYDSQYATNLLNWNSWTQLIGYRTSHIVYAFRVYLSVEALRYYVPAFMLHWLYFRHENRAFEIEELFIPPDDKIICEEFSNYGFYNDRKDVDPFYWFRDGMTEEQRKVCREFCTLWVPWKYRDIDFSLVEEAYLRLLSYWE